MTLIKKESSNDVLQIREITKGDLPVLFDLYTQLCGQPGNYAKMESEYDLICNDPHYMLLGAYWHGALVGTVTLSKCLDLTGESEYYYSLENLVVDEKYRNEGIGTRLLKYAERIAAERNIHYISLSSSAHREKAHLFYQKNGYADYPIKGFKKIIGEKGD